MISEENFLIDLKDLKELRKFTNRFGCNITIQDEDTKIETRVGDGKGKVYRFYLKSEYYCIKEDDLV